MSGRKSSPTESSFNNQQQSAHAKPSVIQQPAAQSVIPSTKLSSFLRSRLEYDVHGGNTAAPGMNGAANDVARSSSAPPTQIVDLSPNFDDPRANPEYAAYFYTNSRLDPRLPPPIYAPGQSWQMWSASPVSSLTATPANPSSGDNQWRFPPKAPNTNTSSNFSDPRTMINVAPGSPTRRRNLVEMIQNDFPRTPSPISSQIKSKNLQQPPMPETTVIDSPFSVPRGPSVPNSNSHVSNVDWNLENRPSRTPPPIGGSSSNHPPRPSSTPPVLNIRLALQNQANAGYPNGNNVNPAGPVAAAPVDTRYSLPTGITEGDDEQFLRRISNMNIDNSYQNEPAAVYGQQYAKNNQIYATNFNRLAANGNTTPTMRGNNGAREMWINNNTGFNQNPTYQQPQQFIDNSNMGMDMNSIHPGMNNMGYRGRDRDGPVASMRGAPSRHNQKNVKDQRNKNNDSPGNVNRSSVLEEFRNNRNKNFDLKDILGYAVEFSTDQHGSRFIQQKLEISLEEDKAMLFQEIYPQSYMLMSDVFGNYVIQKFFEFGVDQQKSALVSTMKGNILTLALQMYGCRVVQKALEYINLKDQLSIIHELDGNIIRCVQDQNGNHVIQKAIECIPYQNILFVIQAFKGKAFDLATHPYGCRVIQRIFERCPVEQMELLMVELRDSVPTLLTDQYGNYVIQNMLEKGQPEDKKKVISMVKGQLLALSKHKFASNVIEKCIVFCSELDRQQFIDEIIQVKPDGTNPLLQMMKDQFANYVIQKMLDVSAPEQRAVLITHIRPHFSSLKKFTYGKHIISKIEKLEGSHSNGNSLY